ncbi:MAG: hypothetical protein ACLS8D_06715 [Clostridioides difficile]
MDDNDKVDSIVPIAEGPKPIVMKVKNIEEEIDFVANLLVDLIHRELLQCFKNKRRCENYRRYLYE